MVKLDSPFRLTVVNIWLLVLSISVGRFLKSNPIFLGIPAEKPATAEDFSVILEHPALDSILLNHKQELGDDYEAYRNHCLRVLSFSVYHLEKNATERAVHVMAVALAYHDIGLWTTGKLNYLEPSVEVMEKELAESVRENEEEHPLLTADELETAREIIRQHHKYTDWSTSSTSSSSADPLLVNAVRKADWADATYGIMKYGLFPWHIEVAYQKIPEAGFHAILAGMGKRLSPDSFKGQVEVLNIFKY